ncbi:MAG: hypothetical protein ACRDRP_13865 [Pseudonocardiaceae bacterium]
MVRSEPQRDRPDHQPDDEERRRLDDELIGLDRDHPEVQAFAEHLDRTHRLRPGFTVEGELSGVADFADSVNRAQGPRWAAAVGVVALILLGVAVALWEAAIFILTALLG